MKSASSRKILIISGVSFLVVLLAGGLLYRLCRNHYGSWLALSVSGSSRGRLARSAVDTLDALYAVQLRLRPSSRIAEIDGMQMVYVPAGEYTMGDDRPIFMQIQHDIYLDSFWIDSTEISNAHYAGCVQDGACPQPWDFATEEDFLSRVAISADDFAEMPVVYIVWEGAVNYCQWAGRRLPSEAEWEKAARGSDGRVYPWGKRGPNPNLLNYDDYYEGPQPVGRYPFGASPYGALNMAGNVREWVADWYSETYYNISPEYNPPGPELGKLRVLRGGAFDDTKPQVRANNRFKHDPYSPGFNRGFRCALSP